MDNQNRDIIIYWPFFPKLWCLGRKYAQGSIREALRDGPWTFWYLSGKEDMKGNYLLGKKTGAWTKWWENGNRQSQGEFRDGLMEGLWTDWYDNGRKAQESTWDNGRQTGETKIFDRNTGQLIQQIQVRPDCQQRTFTLITARDAVQAVKRARVRSMQAAWASLVGVKAARLLEPWQAALWVLLLIPIFSLLSEHADLGMWTIPAAMAGAGILCILVILLTLFHDYFTRADYGAGPE